MDKTAIKNFAIQARKDLIAGVKQKAYEYGIDEKSTGKEAPSGALLNGRILTSEEQSQRNELLNLIKIKDYNQVMEEVAYTWFNRFIALRFMEVNEYLPSRIRVFTNDQNEFQPEILSEVLHLDLEGLDKAKVMSLLETKQTEELYKYLLITQCNALNSALPDMFEKIQNYTELLFPNNLLKDGSVLSCMISNIPKEDWKEAVEIIGWMYQYYNEERKNEVINIYKGTIKKNDIPAATQLFTTDWVVRYMVDNSLGRYWIERNPNSKLKDKLAYFITPQNNKIEMINEKIDPKELTFFDPCMGSGHILVYAFDVLIEIYRECGYSDRDAAICILADNIYGLDIDDRAYQLAYFAVMMKARSYNRHVLTMKISLKVCSIKESNGLGNFNYRGVTTDTKQNEIGEYLVQQFNHAKEIGSLQTIEKKDYPSFELYLENCNKDGQIDIFSSEWYNNTIPLMYQLTKQAKILSEKYTIVATNPPYMNKLEGNLKDFVTSKYKQYCGDLFSVFMYRNFDFCKTNGYSAFMTPFVWMFIKTYENLREYIINYKSISSLIQMEYSAFEEATVPICTFVMKNGKRNQDGYYFKLSEFKGGMDVQKTKILEAIADKYCGYFYETDSVNFSRIPGMPIAYWVSESIIETFIKGDVLENIAEPRKGLTSANDAEYLRLWSEVSYHRTFLVAHNTDEARKSEKKWFPVDKGGEYRKWYGNNEYVINWENDGSALRSYKNSAIRNTDYYFRECIAWNDITSKYISFRFKQYGQIFNDAGPSIFGNHRTIIFLLALGNSIVGRELCSLIAPTIHYGVGQIAKIPVIFPKYDTNYIEYLAEENIKIEKCNWDSSEASWDFNNHPLIELKTNGKLADSFTIWSNFTKNQFEQLKMNEEELNRLFISIYELNNELTPKVDDNDITFYKANLFSDIRSFISYAVGAIFGRYSLDVEGLIYAGGDWDDRENSTIIPDKDNILPISDDVYFKDDIVSKVVDFVEVVYGKETLEENLQFIADALGNRGESSREVIRNYFLIDFYKDHLKIYQKRPIYWLFDSGNKNGFKALIYMHRYKPDLLATMRTDYVHEQQERYRTQLQHLEASLMHASPADQAKINKQIGKLKEQSLELLTYEEKIHHLADQMTDIDLDDGVKVNYAKFRDVLAPIK